VAAGKPLRQKLAVAVGHVPRELLDRRVCVWEIGRERVADEILQLAHQRYRVWRIEAEVIEPACAIDLVGWSSSPVRDMCGQHRFDLFVALHPVLLRVADRAKRAALTVVCATLTR
jgi:hypothetical protein